MLLTITLIILLTFILIKLKRKGSNYEETQYLNLIKELLENENELHSNRTAVRTLRKAGHMFRFNIEHHFPLITTKSVSLRNIFEELMWFINGQTNVEILREKKVNIWNKNTSKAFIENLGLPYEENDPGPIYGFQWRHFGAEYKDCKTDYTNKGFDQLQYAINQIKTNPNSRSIIISAWNPLDLDKICLPPCHCFIHFLVNNNKLTTILYQRSGDIGLGVPYNIASYALLTYLIAKETDTIPYEFIHFIGDAHIYENHIDALKIQVKRIPRPFPILKIKEKRNITDYKFEDLELINYDSYPNIKMEMVA